MINWGYRNFAKGGSTQTYPLAYNTIAGRVALAYEGGDGAFNAGVLVSSLSLTGFKAHGYSGGTVAAHNASWISIGY